MHKLLHTLSQFCAFFQVSSKYVCYSLCDAVCFLFMFYVSCVLFKGHEKEALNLMSTYLPKDTGPGSAYSEGGGLFALGMSM